MIAPPVNWMSRLTPKITETRMVTATMAREMVKKIFRLPTIFMLLFIFFTSVQPFGAKALELGDGLEHQP